MKTLEERFWAKVETTPFGECWLWIGALTSAGGYGRLWDRGRLVLAHRVSWEIAKSGICGPLLWNSLFRSRYKPDESGPVRMRLGRPPATNGVGGLPVPGAGSGPGVHSSSRSAEASHIALSLRKCLP